MRLLTRPVFSYPASRDYYISASGTGDGLTSSTPMSQADFRSATLSPGDNIYFNRGDIFVWPEYDIVRNNIDIDAFGSGANPILYGSIDLGANTFASEGSSIYSTTVADLDWLWIDGTAAKCGETPWWQITSAVSTTVRRVGVGNFASYPGSMVGAKLIGKEFDFRTSDVHTVTNVNTGTGDITFDPPLPANSYIGAGLCVRLFNQLQFISANGDWYYDDSIDKLYVKAASNPGGTQIRAGVSDYAFNFNSASDCSIQNIEFQHYYKYAVLGTNVPRISITFSIFKNVRGHGVRIHGSATADFVFDDNEVDSTGLLGLEYGAVQRGSVSRNIFTYIGMQPNVGFPFDGVNHTGGTAASMMVEPLAGLKAPKAVIFDQNQISFVGYQGIQWWGTGAQFTRNIIHDACLRWNDGGAIHTVYRSVIGNDQPTTGLLFQNNIIYRVLGSVEGTNHVLYVHGIYEDNGTGYSTIDKNTVLNVQESGLVCNYDTTNSTVTNNHFYNCPRGIRVRQDTSTPTYNSDVGNVFTGNIFAMINNTQTGVYAETAQNTGAYNPFSSGGSSNLNAYVNPYTTNIAQYKNNGTGITTDYTLTTWRTKNSADAGSTERTNYITYTNPTNAVQEVKIEINETDTAVNFNVPAGYTDQTGAAFSNPVSIPAYSSLLYFKDTAYP